MLTTSEEVGQFIDYLYNSLPTDNMKVNTSKRQSWTSEEDKTLCDMQNESHSWSQISRQLGRSEDAVRQRWNRINNHVAVQGNKHSYCRQRYSKENDLLIIRYVEKNGLKWDKLSALMNKSKNGIRNRYKRLKS